MAVAVSLKVPDTSWSLKPEGVYQVGKEIWAVWQLTRRRGGIGMMVITTRKSTIYIASTDLPVKQFILGKRWGWKNTEPYTFIPAGGEGAFRKKLAAGKKLPWSTKPDGLPGGQKPGAPKPSKPAVKDDRPDGKRILLQEPGIIELKDGRLMMFCRTDLGSQYVAWSSDGGDTWTEFEPSQIISPRSPASIERIPKTGDLLLVWNNHHEIAPEYRGRRSPLHVAISRDEGKTWEKIKVLEDDPGGHYCYTAIKCVGDHVLLAYCAGQRATGGLRLTQITRLSLEWLYAGPPQ